MKIVGVGCGPGMLTEEARKIIQENSEIYGSKRALKLANCLEEGKIVENWSKLEKLPDKAVLLSTGDPAFSGLNRYSGKKQVSKDIAVHDSTPGISSYQLACNRLGLDMEKTMPLTAHGGTRKAVSGKSSDRGDLAEEMVEKFFKMGLNVYILPGENRLTVKEIQSKAEKAGYNTVVFERLGYEDEKILKPVENRKYRKPYSAAAGPDI